jgi:alpha-1,2-mannosyltransferase
MDSPFTLLKRHWPIALIALLFGVYGWALVVATGTGHDGAIGPRFNALGADWVIFLAAARAFFTGDLAHIYNQGWITQVTNSQFAHWLSAPLPFPLFPYPPVFLLLVLPFAKLPVGLSLLLSQLVQFAALAFALQRLAPGKSYLFFLVGAFLCPAAANNVLAGSNAVLVAALIISGMALLDTKPLIAGALLGVVIFKPQFFPLLPLALIAAGQGRALAGMMACIAILVLLSVALFGPALWLDWFNVYLQPQQVAGVNGTDWGHSWDESVSTCVLLLGAPHGLATAAQVLAAGIGAAAAWRAFRIRHPWRLAILLVAVLLASPHVSNYDLVLLAVAALIHVRALPETSRPLVLMLPLAAWAAPLYNPPRAMPLGLVTPLLLLGLIWALFAPFGASKSLRALI